MKNAYPIRNITELRANFWEQHTNCVCVRHHSGKPKRQNYQPADTRTAFVEYIDTLARSGSISEKLAQSATL